MGNPFTSLLAPWRRPKTIVLDLRPLQCGYAGKGIGRYTLECARRIQAAAHREAGEKRPRFQVSTLVRADRENPIPELPVLIAAPPVKRPWLWDQTVLPFLLIKHRVGLFHTFVAMGPLAEISYPAAFAFRTLATVHDWHMFAPDAPDIDRFYRNTWRIGIQKRYLPKVRRLVVDSEQVKVDSIMQGGVNGERVRVVPLGGGHFDEVEPGSWQMENFVLSVGDTPTKNLPLIRDALTALRTKFIHLNWVIVGDLRNVEARLAAAPASPPDAAAPAAPASPSDPTAATGTGTLPSWISVLENPNDAVLKACYQKALCLLFPSTREGFGIPALEAMRLGCPVLAADIEPLKSLVGNPAALLPPGDPVPWTGAVRKLLFFPDTRKANIAHGKARAAEFSWDRTAEELVKLYLE